MWKWENERIIKSMHLILILRMAIHLDLYKIVIKSGLSAYGLSMPNFKARVYLLTYSLILASEANTQLV